MGAADVHGGFYVEGINGVINSERDLTSGKRADDGTWEVGIDYNHGQMVLCTGMFCSPDDRVTPKPKYVTAHTCAAIRFEYAANSSSTVYELPNQQALDSCDFSNAILRGDEAAGSPHFDVLIDYDHDKTVYFYASRVGCTDGQKVAVNVVEDHESNFAQCEGMGAGSSRIRHCDCNHQLKPSTLMDPCHTAFVYGCLRDMPDDLSCCPDETVTYDAVTRKYVNATGGSHNTGTCISKSKVESNLEIVPILKGLRTSDPARLSAFDGGPCVRYSFQTGYDSMCGFYKSISMCDVASKPHECQFDPAWLAWTTWAPPDDGTPPPPTPMSFVDDAGVTHTWTKAQPKIVAGAFDAIALMHMGMDSSQIMATFGTRGTSGSNVNGYCECPPFEHGAPTRSLTNPVFAPCCVRPQRQPGGARRRSHPTVRRPRKLASRPERVPSGPGRGGAGHAGPSDRPLRVLKDKLLVLQSQPHPSRCERLA